MTLPPGHDHFGGYHRDEHGVHHCTFCSPLNRYSHYLVVVVLTYC